MAGSLLSGSLISGGEIVDDELMLQLERLREENENLYRIMRERANAKRKLQPKKEHNGYLVILTEEYDLREAGDLLAVWRTVLQTPYDAAVPVDAVRRRVMQDFQEGILASLDVERMVTAWEPTDEENLLFRWKFRANAKAGFWEIVLYHTEPIRVSIES